MALPLATSASRSTMSVVGGRTIERRTRISRPDDENARCRASRAEDQPNDFSTHAAVYNTFNIQRHLTSASTHRGFRAAAMDTWHAAVAVA